MYPFAASVITRCSVSRSAGFTLLEVLASLAVMALLTIAAVPALGTLGSSGRLASHVSQLGDLLEKAHAEALVRNSYVWVGLQNVPGRNAVAVTVVAAARGQATDLAQNDLVPLVRPALLENLRLANIPAADLQGTGRETGGVVPFEEGDLDPASSDDHLEARIAGTVYRFDRLLQISPSGEVRVAPARAAWVEIGLVSTTGHADFAVLQMNGVTGRVVTNRR